MASSFSIGKISVDTGIDFSGYRKDRAALLADLEKLAESAARSMTRALSSSLSNGLSTNKFGIALRKELVTGTQGLDITFQRNLSRAIKGLGNQLADELNRGLAQVGRNASRTIPRTMPGLAPTSPTSQNSIPQQQPLKPVVIPTQVQSPSPDELSNVIVGSILKANIATALASGLIGGISGAIQGSVGLLKTAASSVLGDVTAGIRQEIAQNNLTAQVKSQSQLESEVVAGASAIQAKGQISFVEGQASLLRMQKELARQAATLPGNTSDYVTVLNRTMDELVDAFRGSDRKLDPNELKQFEQAATNLARNGSILALAQGINPGLSSMGISRALNGASMAQLRQLQFFENQPYLLDEMQRRLRESGATDLSELTSQSRAQLIQDTFQTFVTPERIEAASNSFEGIYQSGKAKLFDQQTGLLSIGRDLGGGESAFKSIKETLKSLIGDDGFFTEFANQAKAAGLETVDPMLALKNTIDGIKNSIVQATAGMQAFFATDLGQSLIVTMNQLGDVFAALPSTIGQALTAIAPLALSITQSFLTVSSAVTPLIMSAFTGLTPVLTDLVQQAIQIITSVAATIQQNQPQIQSFFTGLGEIVSNIFTALQPVIEAMLPILQSAFQTVIEFAGNAGETIREIFEQVQPRLQSLAQNVLPSVVGLVSSIFPLLQSIGNVLLTIFDVASRAFLGVMGNPIVQTVLSGIAQVLTVIVQYVTDVFNWLSQQKGLWETILTVLGVAAGFIAATFIPAIVAIGAKIALITVGIVGMIEAFKLVWEAIKVIDKALNGVFDWIGVQIKNAIAGLADGWNRFSDAIGTAIEKNDLLKSGFNFVKGIVDRIGSAWNSMLEVIPRITEKLKGMAPQWLKDLMGMINGSNQQGAQQAGQATSDQFAAAVIAILESPSRQGRVDVAQVMATRAQNNFSRFGTSLRDQVWASGQFAPTWEYKIGKNEIQDEKSAIAALQKAGWTQQQAAEAIRNFFADVRNDQKINESQSKIGNAAYFNGVQEIRHKRPEDFQRSSNENFFGSNWYGDRNTYKPGDLRAAFGSGVGGALMGAANGVMVGSGSAIASGLFTGPKGAIGAGAEYHIDTKFQRSLGMQQIGKLFDQIAAAYEAQGRFIEFSNNAVAGLKYELSDPNRLQKLQAAISAHHSQGRDASLGRYSVDYYAPKRGEDRYGKSVEGHEIMLPNIPGAKVKYGQDPGGYGNYANIVDSRGNLIMQTGHGDMNRELPGKPRQFIELTDGKGNKSRAMISGSSGSQSAPSAPSSVVTAANTSPEALKQDLDKRYELGAQGKLQRDITKLDRDATIRQQKRDQEDRQRTADRESRNRRLETQISGLYKSEQTGQKQVLELQLKREQQEEVFADKVLKFDREIEDVQAKQRQKQLRINSVIEARKSQGQTFDIKKATPAELKELGIDARDYQSDLNQLKKQRQQLIKERDAFFEPLKNQERKAADDLSKSNRSVISSVLLQGDRTGEQSPIRKQLLEIENLNRSFEESERTLKANIDQTKATLKSTVIDEATRKKLVSELTELEKQLANLPNAQKEAIEVSQRRFEETQQRRFESLMRSANEFAMGQDVSTADSQFLRRTEQLTTSFQDRSIALRDFRIELEESLKVEGLSAEQKAVLTKRLEETKSAQDKLNEALKTGNKFLKVQYELDKRREVSGLRKQIIGEQINSLEQSAIGFEKFNPQAAIELRRRAAGLNLQASVEERAIQIDQTAAERRQMLQSESGRNILASMGIDSESQIEQLRLESRDALRQQTVNDLEKIKAEFPVLAEELRSQVRDAFSDGLRKGIRSFIDGKGFNLGEILTNIADVFINKGIDMVTQAATNGLFGDGQKNQGLLGGLFTGAMGQTDPVIDSAAIAQQYLSDGGITAGQNLVMAAQQAAQILAQAAQVITQTAIVPTQNFTNAQNFGFAQNAIVSGNGNKAASIFGQVGSTLSTIIGGKSGGIIGTLFNIGAGLLGGGKIPGFASGGLVSGEGLSDKLTAIPAIDKALRKERLQSGKKPILAALHEGEYVLTSDEVDLLKRYSGGFGAFVPNFADGGFVGSTSSAMGGTTFELLNPEASVAQAQQQNYKFEYQKIGDQEVVTVTQLKELESRLNERNNPQLGAKLALEALRSNLNARRQAGF